MSSPYTWAWDEGLGTGNPCRTWPKMNSGFSNVHWIVILHGFSSVEQGSSATRITQGTGFHGKLSLGDTGTKSFTVCVIFPQVFTLSTHLEKPWGELPVPAHSSPKVTSRESYSGEHISGNAEWSQGPLLTTQSLCHVISFKLFLHGSKMRDYDPTHLSKLNS